ncbi:MAG: ABC transporter permease [Anaerolineae bacterium]|nr:ABC transporter permease [Anaerolineae bacterium]
MEYILERPDLVLNGVIEHVYITVVSVFLASLVGVALGVLITRARALYDPILTIAGIIYTVPSLAMFVLMIPLLGIGFKSAVVALVLYSLLVLIRNTAVGIDSVDPNIIEAARGMGMTSLGILLRIELPLALPIIFAGVRIAAVSAISLATMAAFIGAGGIGELLFEGMSSQRDDKIIAGAFAASVMALGTEVLLRQIEKGISPGISGEFKTLGEHLIDFIVYLRTHPGVIAFAGAALLLLGFFGMTWVEPYATEENIADNQANRTILDEANLLKMTGYDLSRLDSNAPVKRSLQFLPWLAGVAGIVALLNASIWQGPRATAEVLLLCGVLAIFPLLHIYYETQSAVGELGRFSELFRVVRSEINALIGGRVPVNPAELELKSGFTMTVIGTSLILVGALLKSLWYRQRDLEIEERMA